MYKFSRLLDWIKNINKLARVFAPKTSFLEILQEFAECRNGVCIFFLFSSRFVNCHLNQLTKNKTSNCTKDSAKKVIAMSLK